jgi:hypothetical protein
LNHPVHAAKKLSAIFEIQLLILRIKPTRPEADKRNSGLAERSQIFKRRSIILIDKQSSEECLVVSSDTVVWLPMAHQNAIPDIKPLRCLPAGGRSSG